ncbi:MAG: alpha-2-macroglobulin [Prevotella sp.]|nr:alpha-2-macroglobulin [Prevotella sp.]
MKRILFVIIVLMYLMPLEMKADSYTTLWKQVAEAQQKDLPQTQIEVLDKIITKATAEKSYGHLLKAQLARASAQTMVSPDSMDVFVQQLKNAERKAVEGNPVLAAVYQSVLGRIYRDCPNMGDNQQEVSNEYYAQSMSNPALLASQSANGYEPLVIEGTDSKIFYNDLLHVFGFEARDYQTMHDYYLSHNNRPAACLCALKLLQKQRYANDTQMRKSKYVQALDSLLNTYGDLREAGELAIERYNFMDEAEDASAEDKMNYINFALSKWGVWPRMNVLRNAQNQLTLPSFSATIGEGISTPNTPRRVDLRHIVNIQSLTMTVTRVRLDGKNTYNVSEDNDYAKVKKLVVNDGTQQTVTHRYVGQPAYKVMEDSMVIEGLPIGVYLVEFTTNQSNIKTERALLYVSDMYAVHEFLPDNKVRLVALSATTGKPVAGAKIELTAKDYRGNVSSVNTLVCDKQGEATNHGNNHRPNHIYVYTDDDTTCPVTNFWGGFNYYSSRRNYDVINLFSDRSVYRPGQTAHVSLVAYKNIDNSETEVLSNKTYKLTLRDANHKVVAEQDVVTDEYGTASYDFVLPSSGLTGQFGVFCDKGGNVRFSVEEYKRPTFQVEFDEVKEKYQNGDTVTVRGKVASFAGVPVQGAKVAVKVVRRQALWWYRYDGGDVLEVLRDTLVTDDDGVFTLRVPLTLPEKMEAHVPQFYNFLIDADVTDVSGESHSGSMSIPLSNRATAFSVEMPQQVEADSVKKVVFHYLNNAGKGIDGTVSYYIDDVKNVQIVNANESFTMAFNRLKSGKHQLVATCGTDTLTKDFIVFSMKDKHPAMETHDWFYQSATEFSREGKPVYVQMGSSDKDQHIVYTLISGNNVLESGVIDQSNAVTTREFTYKEEYGDGILLTCAWVREGQLYQHSARISKALPDKRLMMEWTTFRDRLTPGQKEEWSLRVRKPDGNAANAQLMAVLFDRSLDEIRHHGWSFNPDLYRNLPYTAWQGRHQQSLGVYGELPYKLLNERVLTFSHFDDELFNLYPARVFGARRGPLMMSAKAIRVRGSGINAMDTAVEEASTTEDKLNEVVVVGYGAAKKSESTGSINVESPNSIASDEPSGHESIQVRENLNETAFFYPALRTDGDGNVKLSFTLPESITTWRFIGLAHDKEVNFGFIEGETVAKKTVMVQPNMPRFLRTGDVGQVSAKLFNTSEKDVSGTSEMQLIDPETEKVVYRQAKTFKVEAGKTSSVSFDVDANNMPSLLICKVIASGEGFSDGEQHYLPILPDKELVTNTYPFVQRDAGTLNIDLDKLFPVKDKTNRLTVEYTNNPTWLMIQALPTVAAARDKDIISRATAYYANSIASNILHQSPDIKKTIEQWQRETGEETSLMSSLQKNQELKSLVLDETPWVMDADREADQKALLVNFFDENQVEYRLNDNLQKMESLQNADGSWSWWPGMRGSLYMTVAVSEMLVRLNQMIGKQDGTANMLTKAFKFMGKEMLEEVAELKRAEKKGVKNPRPSEVAVQWLYVCALDGRSLPSDVKQGNDYMIDLLSKQTSAFSIYGKAVSSVVFAKNGKTQKAKEYLQSIKEYTVYKDEMGRYFDTPKALYSWFDYKIPTQVAAIEALRMVSPTDKQTVEELQRWLLHSKRTQAWDTPVNSVNAVYAFLNGETQQLMASGVPLATIKVDGKDVETSKPTAGLGYVKSSQTGNLFRELTINKTSQGTSWGAAYAQFMQKGSEISDASAGLTVTREVLNGDRELKVGDKVRVRITIVAERDYDFVQVVDKRAACLEPTQQLSGYHRGYYCSPKDNTTNYYFDRLAKGKHQIETEYYVDRTGTYQTGTCTVQCAYAPEYSARTAGKVLIVK